MLEIDDGRELRGDRLLVATGRRPRVRDIGLETVGVEPDAHGVPVDAHLRAAEQAVGDRRRQRTLAADPRRQVPGRGGRREHPRRAAEGQLRGGSASHIHGSAGGGGRRRRRALQRDGPGLRGGQDRHLHARVRRQKGFLTLLSDGERLTGAYALGPEAGEWLQQATLAIRAHIPLDVLTDTIQPFPTFSEIYVQALKVLGETADRGGDRSRSAPGPPMAS